MILKRAASYFYCCCSPLYLDKAHTGASECTAIMSSFSVWIEECNCSYFMLGLCLQGNFLLPFSNIPSSPIFRSIFAFIKEEILLKCNLSFILRPTFTCSVLLLCNFSVRLVLVILCPKDNVEQIM